MPLPFAPLHKPKAGCTFALLDSDPNPYLNPSTRTWFPIAETWDLKMDSRSARSADPTSRQLGQHVVLSLPIAFHTHLPPIHSIAAFPILLSDRYFRPMIDQQKR